MSKLVAKAYHPINDSTEDIWEGFFLAMPILWFPLVHVQRHVGLGNNRPNPSLWYIRYFLVDLPIFANAQYAKSLLDRGYLNEAQWKERNQTSRGANRQDAKSHITPSIADELAKLAALKAQGVLSDEEFNKQKLKILS